VTSKAEYQRDNSAIYGGVHMALNEMALAMMHRGMRKKINSNPNPQWGLHYVPFTLWDTNM
jgi:hypothetical protein